MKKSLQECQEILVPDGYKLANYLSELESRWGRLLDNQARANLAEDVKSLIRDHMRRVARINRHPKFTIESLSDMADAIISHNITLRNLNDQDALRLYIQIYLIKLFNNIAR
jgi:hypothetical protein